MSYFHHSITCVLAHLSHGSGTAADDVDSSFYEYTSICYQSMAEQGLSQWK